MNREIHADCGTPLVDGRCPFCNFVPDMQSVEIIIAADEVNRSAKLPADEPHEFIGRVDRDCERCNKPDRNPIHFINKEIVGIDLTVIGGIDLVHDAVEDNSPVWIRNLPKCPFCDEPNPRCAMDHDVRRLGIFEYYLWCERCKARGPIGHCIEQAIASWNQRPPQ